MVFDNKTLVAIARMVPTTLIELARIPGIGPAKLEQYGDAVLALLATQMIARRRSVPVRRGVIVGARRATSDGGYGGPRDGRPHLLDRPVWRGRLHTWAFAAAIPAGIVLIAVSARGGARRRLDLRRVAGCCCSARRRPTTGWPSRPAPARSCSASITR